MDGMADLRFHFIKPRVGLALMGIAQVRSERRFTQVICKATMKVA